MTIPEACQLIMQAAVMGQGSETFVLDMGEPIKIRYLAEQMIRLSGRQPGRDVMIEYVGLRPGEKLFEELFYPSEDLSHTQHPKIHIAHTAAVASLDGLDAALDELRRALACCDEQALLTVLERILPNWRSSPLTSGEKNLQNSANAWQKPDKVTPPA